MNIIKRIQASLDRMREIPSRLDDLQKTVGRIELLLRKAENSKNIHENEAKIYSQWGEDGVIQFLLRHVKIQNKIFVEFGVSNYKEANTRFLLQNDNWSGLVMDGFQPNIESIKNDPLYWRYNLKAECTFVDRSNINDILTRNGVVGDIGLLSIDIDGNDYWIWDAINCIVPRIVICEYHSLFGWQRKVTIPYAKSFDRNKAHFSRLYYGASIAAFAQLATEKGYSLVGSNSAGCNLFFVRKDVLRDLPVYTPEQAYVRAQFREARGPDGRLTYLDFDESLKLISEMPLYDLDSHNVIKVRDLAANPDAEQVVEQAIPPVLEDAV